MGKKMAKLTELKSIFMYYRQGLIKLVMKNKNSQF